LSDKPIQATLGERLIALVADFARADVPTPDQLAASEFAYVEDRALRAALADVYYGARWLYKLGLALLVKDTERAAHVRAQLVDYASICEALLSDAIGVAIRKGRYVGDVWKYSDPDRKSRPIPWELREPAALLSKQTFWWFVRIAREFGIVGDELTGSLDWLRNQRNAVHLRQFASLGHAAYLNQSKKAYGIMMQTISETKSWRIRKG